MQQPDPAQIEAHIERDRAAFASSVHALRNAATTDHLLGEVTALAKAKLGPMTQAVDTAVRTNPVAAGMAAVGIAWLIFGRKSSPVAYDGTLPHAIGRWEDEGGPAYPDDAAWIAETDGLRQRAKAALADLDRAARARLRPAADLARERAAIIADLAANTRKIMAHGLDAMSDTARANIITAREKAYEARVALAQKGSAMVEDHPLVTGAIALAAGAAVARAFPVTEAEHRILGPERDRLFAEAQRLLDAERARLVGPQKAA